MHEGPAPLNLVGPFEHRLGQLLDEQWHSIGALYDLFYDFASQRRVASKPADEGRNVTFAKPI
jgi:hypothetical protein